MLLNILFAVLGAALVLFGADKLTDSSVAIARRFSMSEMMIGLTIVAFGTSLPELVVSLTASIEGVPAMSVANIVGSNVFNTLAIVGCTALVGTIAIPHSTIVKDIPFVLLASVVLFALAMDSLLGAGTDILDRGDGVALLAFFTIFMFSTLKLAEGGVVVPEQPTDNTSAGPQKPLLYSILFLIVGLAALIGGGELFVDGASGIAKALGVSDAVIGLTLVAGGTSLPELATSVIAARKGQSGIAIGNVIGSNLFNIFWILGLCSVVRPLPVMGLTVVDFAVLVLSAVLFWLFSRTRHRITRGEGFGLVAVYVAYLAWLIMNAGA